MDKMNIKVSVVVSFYNNLSFLKLLLAGFSRQSFRDFEVIIADDGSNTDIVRQLEEISRGYFFPIVHVWQNDKGWRKNRVLNKAINAASADYLIFVDGDCVPHKNFVEDHYSLRKKGLILGGRRVMLNAKMTRKLDEEKVRSGYLEKTLIQQLYYQVFGTLTHAQWGIRIQNKVVRYFIRYKRKGIKGCNFSAFRSDILDVNGFDERYTKPTIGEDDDLNFRLLQAGKKVKIMINRFVQYHLYHKPLSRDNQENRELFETVKAEGLAYTPFGINSHSVKTKKK